MPHLLTLRTIHEFTPGDMVRVKRHGYAQHHELRLVEFETPENPDEDWAVRVEFDGGRQLRFYIDGTYATVATADTAWGLIPHPQSDFWAVYRQTIRDEIEEEIEAMGRVEPTPFDQIPVALRKAVLGY